MINGEPYGLKADVWSLGVLLYELMALRKPFEATSLPSLALQIVSTNYPPPPAAFSPELASVLSHLLEWRQTSMRAPPHGLPWPTWRHDAPYNTVRSAALAG